MRSNDVLAPPSTIALSTTVNSLLAQCPSTAVVFNAFGLDSCCGGAGTVREACIEAGADPELVLASLQAAMRATSDDAHIAAP